MRRAPAVLCLLAAGCWLTPAEVDERIRAYTDPDTGDTQVEPQEPIEILGVEPEHGTNAGGDTVTVEVGPLAREAEVWFGDQQATVLDQHEDRVVVQTPPRAGTGRVAVRVRAGDEQDELAGAFRYWADAQGKTGVFGELLLWRYQGSYWTWEDDETPLPHGEAWFRFYEPHDHPYTVWWGFDALDLGSCKNNAFGLPSMTSRAWAPVPPTTLTRAGGSAITLDYDSGNRLFETEIVEAQWAGGSSWQLDLQPVSDLPLLAVPGFVATPSSVAITSPNVSGSTMQAVASTFTVQWSEPHDGDFVVLWMSTTSWLAGHIEYVVCLAPDTGSFTVPGSSWTSWGAANYIVLRVGRMRLSEATLPHDRSQVQTAGGYFSVGAAYTSGF